MRILFHASALLMLASSALALPCPASPQLAPMEHQALQFLNATRANPRYQAETRGRAHALVWNSEAADVARCHAVAMARAHVLSHADASGANPGVRLSARGIDWTAVGENVAMASTLSTIDQMLMHEPPFQPNHRANILNPTFIEVGIGIARSSDGLLWLTEDFLTPPTTPANDVNLESDQPRRELDLPRTAEIRSRGVE